MRVRFLRGTALGGVGNDAQPGEVRDLPAAQAATLVSAGRAVPEHDEPEQLAQALAAVQTAQHAMVAPQPAAAPPRPARKSSKKE
jgi:hypothetical protein